MAFQQYEQRWRRQRTELLVYTRRCLVRGPYVMYCNLSNHEIALAPFYRGENGGLEGKPLAQVHSAVLRAGVPM